METLKEWIRKIREALWSWVPPYDDPKPLLILDMNKLLVARAYKRTLDDGSEHANLKPYLESATLLGEHYTWKRPHLDRFLDWAFENFEVAVWSSAWAKNVDLLCDHVFGEQRRKKLLFEWDQTHCTQVMPHPDGVTHGRPLYRKDLTEVWKAFPQYNSSSTLIVDDCKHKTAANWDINVLIVDPWQPFDNNNSSGSGGMSRVEDDIRIRFAIFAIR